MFSASQLDRPGHPPPSLTTAGADTLTLPSPLPRPNARILPIRDARAQLHV